jgi:DNA-binding PadR family transcriptional regulator
MNVSNFAAEWPGGRGFAFAKGRGRGGPYKRPEDLERIAMFGPPFGGGRGRRRRGDVRLALLMLLAEEPRNGYQMMQTIEERSGGRWRPSPGAVYPALAQLEDEGLIRSTERDGAKLFEITDAGRDHLSEHGEHKPPWEEGDDAGNPRQLRSDIGEVAAAAWQVGRAGNEQQIGKARELLAETRRGLYRIMAEDTEG